MVCCLRCFWHVLVTNNPYPAFRGRRSVGSVGMASPLSGARGLSSQAVDYLARICRIGIARRSCKDQLPTQGAAGDWEASSFCDPSYSSFESNIEHIVSLGYLYALGIDCEGGPWPSPVLILVYPDPDLREAPDGKLERGNKQGSLPLLLGRRVIIIMIMIIIIWETIIHTRTKLELPHYLCSHRHPSIVCLLLSTREGRQLIAEKI